jgi:hypothetical protein
MNKIHLGNLFFIREIYLQIFTQNFLYSRNEGGKIHGIKISDDLKNSCKGEALKNKFAHHSSKKDPAWKK